MWMQSRKLPFEVWLLSRNHNFPPDPHPTEPGCSFYTNLGEKPVLPQVNAIHLGSIRSPSTTLLPKDKHSLQVNQITSQQSSFSIWNDDRVQSTLWILISLHAMQPTSFPAAYFVSFRSGCLQNPEIFLSSLSIANATKVSYFFSSVPFAQQIQQLYLHQECHHTHFFAHMVTKQSERLELVWPLLCTVPWQYDRTWAYVL